MSAAMHAMAHAAATAAFATLATWSIISILRDITRPVQVHRPWRIVP